MGFGYIKCFLRKYIREMSAEFFTGSLNRMLSVTWNGKSYYQLIIDKKILMD